MAKTDLFVRPDWTLFRTIPTICQKAGVPPNRLRRLIAKELTDNGLDAGANCKVGELPGGGIFVEDDGPGITSTPEQIAWLFSFGRPLASSKVIRRPIRGALGNGTRVVAGAVFASQGSLVVFTNGRRLELTPLESGETAVNWQPLPWLRGMRVEVHLGKSVPRDDQHLQWAKLAIEAAGKEPIYKHSKTSPHFYDSDSFFEFMQSAGEMTIREVFQGVDGGAKDARQFLNRPANSLDFGECEMLLRLARQTGKEVSPSRLRLLGKTFSNHYAKVKDTLHLNPSRGRISAELPFTMEAWAKLARNDVPDEAEDAITVLVNRTPVAAAMEIHRDQKKTDVVVFGCGLGHCFAAGRKPIELIINLQIPYMPITSDGKEPDLARFLPSITTVVERAAKQCQRANREKIATSALALPTRPRGRPNPEKTAKFCEDLSQFAALLKKIDSTVDFRASSRGWCYILENERGLSKGDFDRAQDLINDCRKNGLLPIDFTSEDESRTAEGLEMCDDSDPAKHAIRLAQGLERWQQYSPVSFWHNQPVYIQMIVEKVDLKQLFLPVCRQYHIPIINARGWSDLNLRAGVMRRFMEHEKHGRKPVLLYCGDHDPVGMQMPQLLPQHFAELESAVGWSPCNLIVDRFGLNHDFIQRHNLTWIDGLRTGSGKDLGDPSHRQHGTDFVQQYIRTYGRHKVEANALVVRPAAGRQLCFEAIQKYLRVDLIPEYQSALEHHRQQVKAVLPQAIRAFLDTLAGNSQVA